MQQQLDKIMLVAIYPMLFIVGIAVTLMAFGVISPGVPDKGDEPLLAKRRKMLKWLGPAIIIGIVCIYILKFTGVS